MNLIKKIITRIQYRFSKEREFHLYQEDILFNSIVQNLNINLNDENQKKVLVSYLPPFNIDYSNYFGHTNRLESAVIIKSFMQRGFSVDVIPCYTDFYKFQLQGKRYDVIFGLGKPFEYACQNNQNAIKIIYLTECSPQLSYENESKRLKYFYDRHKKKLKLLRTGKFFNEEMIKNSEYGIFFGNSITKKSYLQNYPSLKLQLMSPSGSKNRDFILNKNSVEKNFLWFGSFGAVHKGLDILLDVFSLLPETKLFICGLSETEKWLFDRYKNCKNIIDMGFILVQSNDYLSLLDRVSFVIHPSACEGMSTSVLTCMRHGLIPVVTPYCGIDVFDFGYLLDDYKVEYVLGFIKKLLAISDLEILNKKEKSFYYANSHFSLKEFEINFNRCLKNILSI